MHEYLETLLRHKSDIVNIEAARAICEMRNVSTADLFRPVAGKSLCENRHFVDVWLIGSQYYSSSSPRQSLSSSSPR
jgi:hypothetical protein